MPPHFRAFHTGILNKFAKEVKPDLGPCITPGPCTRLVLGNRRNIINPPICYKARGPAPAVTSNLKGPITPDYCLTPFEEARASKTWAPKPEHWNQPSPRLRWAGQRRKYTWPTSGHATRPIESETIFFWIFYHRIRCRFSVVGIDSNSKQNCYHLAPILDSVPLHPKHPLTHRRTTVH